ncbi:hypothetical protein GCM10022393_04620 [Aquimarina addita]|uniref:Outer membrane protein beta-barrel domain-containing protein n=1 Tax=Aquimarina addita TaxID=870485 RepID=A0ABP7X9V0_9FLAO
MRTQTHKQKKYVTATLLLIFLINGSIYAQGARFAIKGGINFSNQKGDIESFNSLGFIDDTETSIGWQLGLLLETPIENSQFSLQPSLLLIKKGYQYKRNNSIFDFEIKSNPLYIHAPIPVIYNFNIGRIPLFAGVGPYLSYGIGGKVDSTGDVIDVDFTTDDTISWGNDINEDWYRPFDWGLIFTTGVKLDRSFQVDIAYEIGAANILPDGDDNNYIRNRSFTLNFAYFFK